MRPLTRGARILAAIACTATLSHCGLVNDPERSLQQSEQALKSGDYAEAMIALRRVLAEKPDDGRAQLLLARASMMLGNLEAAGKALEAAEKAGVSDTAPIRAELLMRRGEYAEVLAHIDRAFDGRQPASREWRARALAGLGRCDEAIATARELGASNATPPEARAVIADCYAKHGNLVRARAELEQAIRQSPEHAEAWMSLGHFRQLAGDAQGAGDAWERAAEFADGQLAVPQQLVLHAARADLRIARGDLAGLKAIHQQLVRIAPQASITELLDARIDLMSGATTDAISTLRRLVNSEPEQATARMLLMSAHLSESTYEQARQQIAWLEQDPARANVSAGMRKMVEQLAASPAGSEAYFLNLAAIQDRLGQQDLAHATLERGLTRLPQSRTLAAAAAYATLRAGDAAAARRELQPLAAQAPADTGLQLALAQALNDTGDRRGAIESLERLRAKAPSAAVALALHRLLKLEKPGSAAVEPLQHWLAAHPEDVSVRGFHAEALLEMGDRRRAIAEYEVLLRHAPQNVIALNNLAWLYLQEGDARAVETARRAHALAPRAAGVADTYGWALVETGEVDEGLALLRTADAQGGITQPEIRYHLAAALGQAGQKAEAAGLLRTLLAEHEEFPSRVDATRLLTEFERPGAT